MIIIRLTCQHGSCATVDSAAGNKVTKYAHLATTHRLQRKPGILQRADYRIRQKFMVKDFWSHQLRGTGDAVPFPAATKRLLSKFTPIGEIPFSSELLSLDKESHRGAGGTLGKSDFPRCNFREIRYMNTGHNSKTSCSDGISKLGSKVRKSTYFDPTYLGTGSS